MKREATKREGEGATHSDSPSARNSDRGSSVSWSWLLDELTSLPSSTAAGGLTFFLANSEVGRKENSDGGVQFLGLGFCALGGCGVGEGFNFVRDYYFGFNSSFYGSLGIIMSRGVVGTSFTLDGDNDNEVTLSK